MDYKFFPSIDRDFLYEDEDEIDLIYRLNEYFDCHPEVCCKYFDSCVTLLRKNGKISKGIYENLRSFWITINDHENVDCC